MDLGKSIATITVAGITANVAKKAMGYSVTRKRKKRR